LHQGKRRIIKQKMMKKYLLIYFRKTTLKPEASIVEEVEIDERAIRDFVDNNHRDDFDNIVLINQTDRTWCNSYDRRMGNLQWISITVLFAMPVLNKAVNNH
jgi:hypothetical protein